MNTGVADQFLDVFSRYIDSGFGLLGGEVGFLASTLVVIDVTLAALFWTWAAGDDIIARLIKKTLYVGVFAFLLSNFNGLARIVFESFSGLGLKAAGGSLSAADFLHPGKLAQAGIDAGKPLLEQAQQLCGFPGFFDNFPYILVLVFAWFVVLVAFFVLAVQLFVTLLEFKLTTLAGFVLVPFGLFGKTAFLAERVLGAVMAAGVKVLVLAVIVGIGSTLFSTFVQDFGGRQPDLEQVLSLALGALCLLGLGIFGPAIANGLVSGGPQLGAGAAVGAGLAAGGLVTAGALGARAAVGAGVSGARTIIAKAGGPRPGPTGSGDGGWRPPPPSGGTGGSGGPQPSGGGAPAWARQYRRRQEAAHAAGVATHALRAGDHPGGGTSVSLAEDRS
jgi:type IV secretion system protein TrbL